MSLDEIQCGIRQCTICSSFAPGYEKPPPLNRGQQSPLMIVGQGPGNAEVKLGEPFAGPSGTRLDRWLVKCGAPPDAARSIAYVTSVIKCVIDPVVRSAYARMAANCRPFLSQQIACVRPDMIISLGAYAYRALKIGQVPYRRALCSVFHSDRDALVTDIGVEYSLLPWPHPSGRNRQLNDPAIRRRLERSFPIVRNVLANSESSEP